MLNNAHLAFGQGNVLDNLKGFEKKLKTYKTGIFLKVLTIFKVLLFSIIILQKKRYSFVFLSHLQSEIKTMTLKPHYNKNFAVEISFKENAMVYI